MKVVLPRLGEKRMLKEKEKESEQERKRVAATRILRRILHPYGERIAFQLPQYNPSVMAILGNKVSPQPREIKET